MNIILVVSILCFAMCFVMFLYLKWYVKKRTVSSGLNERMTEVAKLIADIDMITDRDSQLVEDRVSKLKTLLHEVDKRIAIYQNELENNTIEQLVEKRTNETLYTSLGRGIHAALKTPAESLPQPSGREQVLLEQAVPQALPQIIQPQVVQPAVAQQHVAEPQQPELEIAEQPVQKAPSKKQIRAHIDILASEGLSSQEIASRLEISIAEVNLAMNLRRKN